MRRLTFRGFLKQYVQELSAEHTLDMKKLAHEAATANARLQAPLVLYAVATDKGDLLARYLRRMDSGGDMLRALSKYNKETLVETLQKEREAFDAYGKVWNSYCVMRDTPQRDAQVKATMRGKIQQLQREKNCSNYRIYAALGLNPGNINSWLKNGDSSKVSYETAERIMNFVINC
jgi:hypothetical protein